MSNENIENLEEVAQQILSDGGPTKEKIKGVPETTADGVIGSSGTNRKGGSKKGNAYTTKNGAIASAGADKREKKNEALVKKEKPETVAVFSTKNVVWDEVGKLSKGYNIVQKDKADKWLKRSHVRIATPEEVARDFGL
jgi:hypothetical protein